MLIAIICGPGASSLRTSIEDARNLVKVSSAATYRAMLSMRWTSGMFTQNEKVPASEISSLRPVKVIQAEELGTRGVVSLTARPSNEWSSWAIPPPSSRACEASYFQASKSLKSLTRTPGEINEVGLVSRRVHNSAGYSHGRMAQAPAVPMRSATAKIPPPIRARGVFMTNSSCCGATRLSPQSPMRS